MIILAQGFMSFELKDIGNGDFEVAQTYAPAASQPRCLSFHPSPCLVTQRCSSSFRVCLFQV